MFIHIIHNKSQAQRIAADRLVESLKAISARAQGIPENKVIVRDLVRTFDLEQMEIIVLYEPDELCNTLDTDLLLREINTILSQHGALPPSYSFRHCWAADIVEIIQPEPGIAR